LELVCVVGCLVGGIEMLLCLCGVIDGLSGGLFYFSFWLVVGC